MNKLILLIILGWSSNSYAQMNFWNSLIGHSCANSRASCLKHLKAGCSTNGYYRINTSDGTRKLYCDMQGGGWTLVEKISSASRNHSLAAASLSNAPLDSIAVDNSSSAFSKIDDASINLIAANKLYKLTCGNVTYWVRNTEGIWTSLNVNSYAWQINRAQDGVSWSNAVRSGYTFSDFSSNPTGHVNYVSTSTSEGYGCYHDGQGWNLSGALWVR